MPHRIADSEPELQPVFAYHAPRGPLGALPFLGVPAGDLHDRSVTLVLAHDFREFTGLRPSDYLGLRIAGQRNHVRVPV